MKKSAMETIEGVLVDLLSRIENGDKEALNELKELAQYLKMLLPAIDVIENVDTPEELMKALEKLGEKYEAVLLDVFKAVG
ncbi:MAG: hypothetical protein J7L88_06240 [Thermoplasmata archaeon]|nr:hypothetical protein [Thermoplasmata archaeon]